MFIIVLVTMIIVVYYKDNVVITCNLQIDVCFRIVSHIFPAGVLWQIARRHRSGCEVHEVSCFWTTNWVLVREVDIILEPLTILSYGIAKIIVLTSFSPQLCVGFLFLILYPGSAPPPPASRLFTYNNLTYNNFTYNNFTHLHTHTNLTYNNFTHTQT